MTTTSKFGRALAAAAVALCGCGGAGGGAVIGGGIDGSGFVVGPIEGFGSVVVQGIRFDAAGATVTIEGAPGTEADLRLGMVVSVEGDIDNVTMTGVALAIDFEDEVEGPVDSIDAAASSFTVLGQIVSVTATTVFDPPSLSLDSLEDGDPVEVSGYRTATDRIRATRVEAVEDFDDIELSGIVRNLDPFARTFTLSGVAVDYADAEFDGLDEDSLRNGIEVEVLSSQGIVDGFLIADVVEGEDDDEDRSGDEAEIEGFVTALLGDDRFEVGGRRIVRFDGDTQFSNGAAADLAEDEFVEVEGIFEDADTILADEVRFEEGDEDEDDEDDERGRRGRNGDD